jgi:hypothetical protein
VVCEGRNTAIQLDRIIPRRLERLEQLERLGVNP